MKKNSQKQQPQPNEEVTKNKALPFEVEAGWTAMPNALYTVYLKHPEMNSRALAVYGYLLRLHNTKLGYAFPTNAQLAISLGVSVQTIQTSISKLRKVGLIETKYNVRHNNNNYTFPPIVETIEELEEKFPEIESHLRMLEGRAVAILEKLEDDKQRLRDLRSR